MIRIRIAIDLYLLAHKSMIKIRRSCYTITFMQQFFIRSFYV